MTQEEKQLLLKDLCARLPYGVKIQCWYGQIITSDINIFPYSMEEMAQEDMEDQLEGIKPYLRPMSSMTEKEQRYIWDKYGPSFLVADFEDAGDVSELFNYCQMNISRAPSFVDWLNEHHFDYRGLIEKGLALEALEGMYKTN